VRGEHTWAEIEALFASYQPQQDIEETAALFSVLRRMAPLGTVVEIGTRYAGNLRLLNEFCDSGSLSIGIDLYEDDPTWGVKRHGAEHFRGKVEFVTGDSSAPETVRRVDALLGERTIDLLWIDGDHRAESALRDFRAYLPKMSLYGLVAFHDIAHGNPARGAWDAVAAEHSGPYAKATRFIIEIAGSFGIGLLLMNEHLFLDSRNTRRLFG